MPDRKIFDRSTIIKILIGTAVGIGAVYLSFRGVSVDQLMSVIREADPWLVILGVGIVLLNVALLALRWWVMLLRPWSGESFLTLLAAVYLGQMINILLPARLGELARTVYAAEGLPASKSTLLGSLVLEKMIDVITFGLALLLLITAVTLPAWVADPGRSFLLLALIALGAVILLTLWGRPLLAWLTPLLQRLPGNWGERLAGILERGLEGFDSLRRWPRQLALWGLAVVSLLLSTLTNFAVLNALQISVPFSAALFVLLVLQVGSAPPSAPGKLGVYHYLAVLALAAFAVPKDLALAYEVLLYAVALVTKVIIGVGVLIFSKWKLPNMKLMNED